MPEAGHNLFALAELCWQSSDLAPGTIINNLSLEGLLLRKHMLLRKGDSFVRQVLRRVQSRVDKMTMRARRKSC
ncbi:hypothetical protein B5C26_11230 [Photorhabdus luminescens]|nr:hypothetical protein B5C26_11230 [Photorhabdus luminescens]